MSRRVGVFVDTDNMARRINKRWPGRKLDYAAYLNMASEDGDILFSIAYGTNYQGCAVDFVTALRHIGYDVDFKEVQNETWYDWSVGLAIDVLQRADKLDIVILGHANRSMAPLVEALCDRGVKVIVASSGINHELKEIAHEYREITEEMLDAPTDTTKPVVMLPHGSVHSS